MESLPEAVPTRSRRALTGLLLAFAALTFTLAPTSQAPDQTAHAQVGPRQWLRTAVWAPGYDSGALLDPRGIDAAPGGRFYVADRGHDRVAVIDATGRLVTAFGARGDGPLGLNAPTDVAVDAARDRLYVADRGNKRLAVFTLNGDPLTHWTAAEPGFAFQPQSVAVAPATGEVYVISTQPWSRIERFDRDGRWIGGWGDVGNGSGQFRSAQDLVVHPDGRLVVADTGNERVQILAADGAHLSSLRFLPNVVSVAVDASAGRIYALHATNRGVPDRITIFSSLGTPQGTLDGDGLAEPFWPGSGIAVGEGDRIAIAIGPGSPDQRQGVRQYERDGRLAASTTANPLDYAGFFRPEAIEVGPDPDAALFVVEGALRVTKKYSADGAFVRRFGAGAGQEIAVGPDGAMYLFDLPVAGSVTLKRLAPDGSFDWAKACDCMSGMGLAATADRVFASSAISGTVAVFDMDRRNPDPVARFDRPDPPYAWPLDVALGPGDRLYAAGGDNGRLDVLDPAAGQLIGGWSVGGGNGAERVSAAPDGTVFALLLDGAVAAYRPDGTLEQAWRPEPIPGVGPVEPRDIAAGRDGRVYVLDGASGSILVYDAQAVPATPTPPVTPEPPCAASGTKTAAPTSLVLGGEVTVDLRLDIVCRPGSEARADIMLIIDRSSSMAGPKLSDAKTAADGFAARLDYARHRVGLVTFSDIVSLDQPLTSDRNQIRSAIAAVEAAGQTDIAAALERAVRHLVVDGRPGALPVVLLLTDGNPNRIGQPYVDAVRHGSRARARGMLVYAIGLGDNVDARLLTAVAGSANRYFFAPTPDELGPIYDQLSATVGEVVATDVQVDDAIGAEMDYVAGSASPAAALGGDTLRWDLGAVPSGGVQLSLRVKPRRLGRWPTNRQAVARYTADGVRYSYAFPVPEVEVVAPATATLTPAPTPTVTPTATSRPTIAYLPIVMRGWCHPAEARLGADIVLAVDSSSSMAGEKLGAAVDASRLFLTLVDSRRDRVGLVTFDADARLLYRLTADLDAISQQLGPLATQMGTRIDRGLEVALTEFLYHGRDGSQRVVILLSDGQPTPSSRQRAVELALFARQLDVTLFTVGLGADADGDLLRSLASAPDYYLYAPGPADLRAIYELIAVNLPCR